MPTWPLPLLQCRQRYGGRNTLHAASGRAREPKREEGAQNSKNRPEDHYREIFVGSRGLAWHGLAWPGLAWHGMAWSGPVWSRRLAWRRRSTSTGTSISINARRDETRRDTTHARTRPRFAAAVAVVAVELAMHRSHSGQPVSTPARSIVNPFTFSFAPLFPLPSPPLFINPPCWARPNVVSCRATQMKVHGDDDAPVGGNATIVTSEPQLTFPYQSP
jgi:hypothetical protein